MTGTPMRGKMSIGVRAIAITPMPKISTAMTMKVRGRVRATWTIRITRKRSREI